MEDIIKFIEPGLLLLIPVCYFVGKMVMNSETVKNAYIPFINAVVGIVLAILWVIATKPVSTYQEIAMAIFVAIVQGLLCSGCATYFYEMAKQKRLLEDK